MKKKSKNNAVVLVNAGNSQLKDRQLFLAQVKEQLLKDIFSYLPKKEFMWNEAGNLYIIEGLEFDDNQLFGVDVEIHVRAMVHTHNAVNQELILLKHVLGLTAVRQDDGTLLGSKPHPDFKSEELTDIPNYYAIARALAMKAGADEFRRLTSK